jgi:ubiquinone/menaquinone biosynthesis C-methylase UbiE
VSTRQAKPREQAKPPFLVAEPEIVSAGAAPGKVLLRWDAGDVKKASLILEGDPPQVIARAPRGEKELTWIRPGRVYTFVLLLDGGIRGASATVRGVGPGARELVQTLMEPEAYEDALQREGAAWSMHLADPARPARLQADQAAATELGIGRHRLSLIALLSELGVQPELCLSLGCGEGRLERALFARGIPAHFDAVDIAEDALEVARREAAKVGMSATYWKSDLNFVELPREKYDLIVAQTSLHHVLRLEHVVDEMAKALKPDGYLWVHDYVGEPQFQFLPARVRIVNSILAALPEELTWNELTQRQVRQIERRAPGNLTSPFESIRSDEIKPLLLERFEIVRALESDTILSLVCPSGTRAAFARTPETRVVFDVLAALDRSLLDSYVLPPRSGQYLLRKR